jgi:hypothetical protein
MLRLAILFTLCFPLLAQAQMIVGQDTLYGNEWIDYDKTYYRIDVAADGLYRIPYAQLEAAGLPVGSTDARFYQLWSLGEQQPLYTSTPSGPLQPGDYLEFYGEQNRSQLDRFLFEDPDQMLNPYYSLYTDTLAYFLVVGDEMGERYEEVDNPGFDGDGEEWFWGEEVVSFEEGVQSTWQKIGDLPPLYSSAYFNEGFVSAQDTIHYFDWDVPVFENGPDGQFSASILGGYRDDHELHAKMGNDTLMKDFYAGQEMNIYTFGVPAQVLASESSMQIGGDTLLGYQYWIGFIKLVYPSRFEFDEALFASLSLPESFGVRLLRLQNLGTSEQSAVLYDLDNQYRQTANRVSNDFRFRLPAALGERSIVVGADFRSVSMLKPTTFIDFTQQYFDINYLVITHPYLRQAVDEYGAYRSSTAGGGFTPAIMEVGELYEQFAYGNARHPIAIRNAFQFFLKEWTDLQYCFLIGKGQEYNRVRAGTNLSEAIAEHRLLVPTFGEPASDNLLLAWPGEVIPDVPVGRLAAISPGEVSIYLQKVRDFEGNRDNGQTVEERAWMKRIVHLGGGTTPGERSSIRAGLETMGGIAEQNQFGANIESFYREGTEPLSNPVVSEIFSNINKGAAVLTFFGHSSSDNSFYFNIDSPDNYLNKPKYPLMFSFGCYSGNLFTKTRGISERFVFLEDKGTVVFGASRGLGLIGALSQLGRSFYDYMGSSHYGESIGNTLLASYGDIPLFDLGNRILAEQFTLHGDPALKLHVSSEPDYIFEPQSMVIEPKVITAQMDSFSVAFDILNIGRNDNASFSLSIELALPNGSRSMVYKDTIVSGRFRKHNVITLPVIGEEMVGLNTLYVTLDDDNSIEEVLPGGEQNNRFVSVSGEEGVSIRVVDNSARPIWPPKYAVVSTDNLLLKASTTNMDAPEQRYLVEIDTTPRYDSPLKRQQIIQQRGGVIDWEVLDYSLLDSTAYFWRISPDTAFADLGYLWSQSTFTYINGSPAGWQQGNGAQWTVGGNGDRIVVDSVNLRLDFTDDFIDLQIKNKLRGGNIRPDGFINGRRWSDFFRWEASESINITVFDDIGRIVWNEKPGQYGSLNTTASKEIACFPFPVEDTEDRLNIINFLDTIVQPGYTVFFYTAMSNANSDLNVAEWATDSLAHPDGKNIFSLLEAQGADSIRSLEGQMRPYIFIYEKDKTVINERIAATVDEEINATHGVRGRWFEGSFESERIGPVTAWQEVEWSYELNGTDSVSLDIIAVGIDGEETVLAENIEDNSYDLSGLDAADHPYLKLRFNAFDPETTIPRVNYWRVSYEEGREYAFAPNELYEFNADTLSRGAPLSLRTRIHHMGNQKDSLLIARSIIFSPQQGAVFNRLDTLSRSINTNLFEYDLEYDTRLLSGKNYNLSIQVDDFEGQAEYFRYNNLIEQPFVIIEDKREPSIDVTFDGRYILDGELIQPEPTIHILLEDENPYVLLDDTSVIQLFLRLPEGEGLRSIYFANPEVRFEPATDSQNRANIIYQPVFEESGEYELLVKGRDVSNNFAGVIDYAVSFEVETAASVSNVLNYPNPFSTSTQFVYTLTGKELPAEFIIRIMTISGRVVKDIPLHLLEPLEFGTHRTQYRWDGTDEFGDRLANGVYLYQVIVRDAQGQSYEKRAQSKIDRFFKEDFGKMVIMR